MLRTHLSRELLRLARIQSGRMSCWWPALCVAFLIAASPARCTVDLRLNTWNAVPGTPHLVSVDAVVTPVGDSTAIIAATATLKYDPSAVKLMDIRANSAAGWELSAVVSDQASAGLIRAALVNTRPLGQSAIGPILYFTAFPSRSSVDLRDCGTLSLSAAPGDSEIVDQDGSRYAPTAPCRSPAEPGRSAIPGIRNRAGEPETGSLQTVEETLRYAGGLGARAGRTAADLDYDHDGLVTVTDALNWATRPYPRVVFTQTYPDQPEQAPLLGMFAAPAVSDLNGDGLSDVAVATAQLLYREPGPEPLNDPSNENRVYAYSWRDGALVPYSREWPRTTRDAAGGLAIASIGGAPTVIAQVSQDDYATPFKPGGYPDDVYPYFASRLYLWGREGDPMKPWAPWAFALGADRGAGLVDGHSYVTPVVLPLDLTGKPRIIESGEGEFAPWNRDGHYFYRYGSMKIWYEDGGGYGFTQSTDPTRPWFVSDDKDTSSFALGAPPVGAFLTPSSGICIVAATKDGRLYGWNRYGRAVAGWFPSGNAVAQTASYASRERAPVIRYNSVAAANFGAATDDIVVCTGDLACDGFDAGAPPLLNGRIFRFRGADGAAIRSYPDAFQLGFTSGIAVGRIRRANPDQQCIVVGDRQGYVTALDPDLNRLWSVPTTPGAPIVAQPIIGDVNGDGFQDVVVGGSDGYVYALDGDSGALLWKIQVPLSSLPAGTYQDAVQAAPAFARFSDDGRLYVVVLSCASYCIPRTGPCPGMGHLMVIDCGPVNPSGRSRFDWPQYQHDAQRTGRAVPDASGRLP